MPPSVLENSSGKKVFFVQPNSVVQKEMVAELIRQEYEVGLVHKACDAKKVFSRYPDCLAFLNIDEGFSEDEWDTFVREVQSDPVSEAVGLGILTYNPDPELARKYLMEHMVACGFIRLSLRLSESTSTVLKVLEANEARGRRKFLRVHCRENTRLNIKTDSGVIEGQILDLSVVGMACTFSPDPGWGRNKVMASIQLKLKGSLCLVNGVLVGSRSHDGEETVYVVLFDPKSAGSHKETIRAYLQWTLQESVEAFLKAVSDG